MKLEEALNILFTPAPLNHNERRMALVKLEAAETLLQGIYDSGETRDVLYKIQCLRAALLDILNNIPETAPTPTPAPAPAPSPPETSAIATAIATATEKAEIAEAVEAEEADSRRHTRRRTT